MFVYFCLLNSIFVCSLLIYLTTIDDFLDIQVMQYQMGQYKLITNLK